MSFLDIFTAQKIWDFTISVFVAGSILFPVYCLTLDTQYPATVIFEKENFEDKNGAPLTVVKAGQEVYYRKAFCVSANNPEGLKTDLASGKMGFVTQEDTLLQEQRAIFGRIHGITRAKFVNGIQLQLPDRTFEVKEGCYDIRQIITVPDILPNGLYALQFSFTYYNNIVQKAIGQGITRTAKPIYFEVRN